MACNTIPPPPATRSAPAIRPVGIDAVLRAWERALGRAPASPSDDFFDGGGGWPNALTLHDALAEQRGGGWPLSLLYRFRTPAALTAALNAPVSSSSDALALIRDGSTESPLFVVHGLAGWGAELVSFARRIDTKQAVYVIEARGLDGREPPHESLRDAARDYVALIRRHQPRGPYYLSGYSSGGLIALEMARLLVAAGESVPFLCLIDTFFHFRYWTPRARFWRHLFMAKVRFAMLREAGWRAWLGWIVYRLQRLVSGRLASRPAVDLIDPSWPLPTQLVRAAAYRGIENYRPAGSYAGRVHYLLATEGTSYLRAANPRREWGRFIPDLHVHEIFAEHVWLVERDYARSAPVFTRVLREAQGDALREPASRDRPGAAL